jgi:hypothetical protein
MLLTGTTSGCAVQPDFSWNVGPRRSDDGTNYSVQFELGQQINEHWRCAYLHNSIPQKGRPFNDQYETTFDQIGCGMKWGGKRWAR